MYGPNEDSLRSMYDRVCTHDDPHSPYYDGPEAEDEEGGDPEGDGEGTL